LAFSHVKFFATHETVEHFARSWRTVKLNLGFNLIIKLRTHAMEVLVQQF
jgi:hypothetical protein